MIVKTTDCQEELSHQETTISKSKSFPSLRALGTVDMALDDSLFHKLSLTGYVRVEDDLK